MHMQAGAHSEHALTLLDYMFYFMLYYPATALHTLRTRNLSMHRERTIECCPVHVCTCICLLYFYCV